MGSRSRHMDGMKILYGSTCGIDLLGQNRSLCPLYEKCKVLKGGNYRQDLRVCALYYLHCALVDILACGHDITTAIDYTRKRIRENLNRGIISLVYIIDNNRNQVETREVDVITSFIQDLLVKIARIGVRLEVRSGVYVVVKEESFHVTEERFRDDDE